MGIIKPAIHAHPFVAIMFNEEHELKNILGILKNRFGNILSAGPIYKVSDFSDYYEKEFGKQLQKQFFVFRKPACLDNFFQIKVWTNELELNPNAKTPRRILNIDPGYLEPSKLVLYSSKNFSHRIYCGSGIFAEVTMPFIHGDFIRLPWTYDDYYCEMNRNFLLVMRNEIVRISRSAL
ncbi:MAG: DUF4416 family protein [Candidatus Marinimicrobia bacterium]|nr:DUF4416 family protein [Candidatus Neomarinimicrobiota bacterium]